ncbi:MAG: DUF423 domain-containing protein [Patiriisocius sp.]|uniref:DUF423 domain-containing protein n=1 Tax=Patiriisocius sp. TaxID=2822396 RepID=UPI003EF3578C
MKNQDKKIVLTACILGVVTIAIGAFGAHGVKQLVTSQSLATFETGVRYQMYHVLALMVVGFVNTIDAQTKKWVFVLFLLGMLLFSGSIYFLALKDVLSFNISFLGPVTPIGGLLFMVGWLRLGFGIWKYKIG